MGAGDISPAPFFFKEIPMHYEIKSAHGEVLTPKQRAGTLSFDPPTVAGVCLRRGVTLVLSEDEMGLYEAQLKKLVEDESISVTPRPDSEDETKQLAAPQEPAKPAQPPVPTPEEISAQVAADNAAAEAARVAEAQAAGVVTVPVEPLPVEPVDPLPADPLPAPEAVKPSPKKKAR